MNKYKLIAIISYPIAVYLLWINFTDNTLIFTSVTFQAFVHGFVLLLAFSIWIALTYILCTNFISRWIIQRKFTNAKRTLGNISLAKLKSYKPSRTGNYITLVFCSAGVPENEWESKRLVIQSVINYTIMEEIKHKHNDYGTIILRVRKGCLKANKENLYDDEL